MHEPATAASVSPHPAVDAARARLATSAIFLVCGTATSSWAPMVPFAKARLGVDDGTLGLILLAFGGGSLVTMPMAGAAVHYWGTRRVILASTIVGCAALPLLAIMPTAVTLSMALFAFGASLGAMDVAMNAQAIVVQRAIARPIMSRFHALFSVGGLCGAAVLSLLLRGGVSLFSAAAVIAPCLLATGVFFVPRLLNDRGTAAGTSFRIVSSPRVLLLGALCFISFLAEGAVLDWSAVFLRELRQVTPAFAGMGYAAFSVAMVVGRMTGDPVTHRFGAPAVLGAGATVAAAGFFVAAVVPGTPFTMLGFVLVGIGAANIVPVLFSAAGQVPGVPASLALATVTTIAYAGLLLGPALIGFVADWTSLPAAFVLVAAMLGAVALSAARAAGATSSSR